MVVIQLNYITGLVLRKPFEVFCLFVCFFKLRVSQKCCIFPMIYTFYLLHRILYILIWPHPQSKENNLSWLGSWLSHHAPTTESLTGNCLLMDVVYEQHYMRGRQLLRNCNTQMEVHRFYRWRIRTPESENPGKVHPPS